MQTFLPYSFYIDCASVLDYKRLGKQRLEVMQIHNALIGASKGWVNHPATRMWRGHEVSLLNYGITMSTEWIRRGYKDTLRVEFYYRLTSYALSTGMAVVDLLAQDLGPPWLNDPDLHLSHQSNLIRKDPAYYGPLFPGVPDNLPYYWPV
jgi:Pyrimidine dimer DNA glycosylase